MPLNTGPWSILTFFASILGRIKEILITSGGENVAPVPMEDLVKHYLPCISNAILIGDKKKYLSIFLTLKVCIDEDSGLPTDNLTPHAIDWCNSIGSCATTVSEILSDSEDECIKTAIQNGIDKANEKSVSRAAQIKKWVILPKEISMQGGELGPTLKLKRYAFNEKYKNEIDALYH